MKLTIGVYWLKPTEFKPNKNKDILTIGGYWLKPTEFKPNKNKDINTNHKINKNGNKED